MPIIATEGERGTAYEPAPAGLYHAVCVDVVDLGILEVTYAGETKKQWKARVVWELDATREDGSPFLAFKRYTVSLHEKANMRRDLESWRGRAFTDAELKGFDLEHLIGANAQVNVQHRPSADGSKVYANVVGIVPLGKGMAKRVATPGYVRVKDRTATEADAQQHSEELTVDDIPFAWLAPFIVPALALGSLWA